MSLHDVFVWIGQNWLNLAQWIGDIIAIDAVIKQVALKYGFTQLVSICDLIATDLGFVMDVFTSLVTKKPVAPVAITQTQTTESIGTEKSTITETKVSPTQGV